MYISIQFCKGANVDKPDQDTAALWRLCRRGRPDEVVDIPEPLYSVRLLYEENEESSIDHLNKKTIGAVVEVPDHLCAFLLCRQW